MDHEWSRSWNFLSKLIREFLLIIFISEALFGHPVPMGKKKYSKIFHCSVIFTFNFLNKLNNIDLAFLQFYNSLL